MSHFRSSRLFSGLLLITYLTVVPMVAQPAAHTSAQSTSSLYPRSFKVMPEVQRVLVECALPHACASDTKTLNGAVVTPTATDTPFETAQPTATATTAPCLPSGTSPGWVSQCSGTTSALLSISCPTTATCYAVGLAGVVVATNNGGAQWSSQNSGVGSTLRGISCPDALTCYAVGDNGVMVATKDGGTSWQSQSSGTTATLQSISCPTLNSCYAVSGDAFQTGLIFQTLNGGQSWNTATSAGYPMLSISCASLDACYAAGGVLGEYGRPAVIVAGPLHYPGVPPTPFLGSPTPTSVAVSGWQSVYTFYGDYNNGSNVDGALYAISCPSISVCYATGGYDSNVILASFDGGQTWTGQKGFTGNGIACASNAVCYAVGNGIVGTANSGATWSGQSVPTANQLRGVSCPGISVCFAVGDQGTILALSSSDMITPTATSTSVPTATWTASPTSTDTATPQSTATALASPTSTPTARHGVIFTAPHTGTAGSTVVIYGANFDSREPVSIFWDTLRATPLSTTLTSTRGSLVALIHVPQSTAGNHYLIAVGWHSHLVALASFQVTRSRVLKHARRAHFRPRL